MREIKFRLWDKERGEFHHEPLGLFNSLPSNWQQFCVAQQYTGLKDKKGVEIYEGDLVEYPITSYPLEVVWDDFSCAFMLRDIKGYLKMPMPAPEAMTAHCLVIDNIKELK